MSATATSAPVQDGTIEKRNPRTGEVMYTLSEPNAGQLAEVMDRARKVAPVLAKMPVKQRLNEMLKIRAYLIEHREAIAQKISAENGKSITDAMVGDIFTSVDLIDYYVKEGEKILADEKVHTPLMMMGKKSKIMYCPLGPVLVISPWNYPLNTALTPALCAFVAGNPVIMKPSEWTPLHGVLDTIIKESCIVQDSMQVVWGGRETGQALIDLKPAKVFFTGSVRAGKQIMAQCSEHLIPVELELGGKDPMLVFADANMERALNGALWGALNNTGQGCTSVERCFVEAPIYDEFVTKLKEKFSKLSTTDTHQGVETELDLGCITASFQLEKIRAQVEDARTKGAEVWTAYDAKADAPNFPPTIITQVNNDMEVQIEETFGPVITVMPFKTEEEAIQLANDTIYGLSSSVWTSDLEKGDRIARNIEAGNVCINDVMVTEGNSALPFGGIKQSGIGRYKSRVGVHGFCNIKSVMIDGGKNPTEAHWYPYVTEKYAALSKVVTVIGAMSLGKFISLALTGLKLEGLMKKYKV